MSRVSCDEPARDSPIGFRFVYRMSTEAVAERHWSARCLREPHGNVSEGWAGARVWRRPSQPAVDTPRWAKLSNTYNDSIVGKLIKRVP